MSIYQSKYLNNSTLQHFRILSKYILSVSVFLCPEQKGKQQQVPAESPPCSRWEEAVHLPAEPNPDVCPNGHQG